MRASLGARALLLVGLATFLSVSLSCAAPARSVTSGAAFVRRPFAPGVLARRGISYSGYRVGQGPDVHVVPSEAEITEDLELLVKGGWGLIRLFDAGEHAARVLKVIHERHLDLKVVLGAWIAGARASHDEANRADIERAIALAAKYPDLVVALSVGNETLDDWSGVRTPPAELADYIRQVRRRVTLPVTTDDAWQPYSLMTVGKTSYADCLQVLQEIDYASIHIYAFAEAFYDTWDYKQASVPEAERARAMMDAAFARTRFSARSVREVLAAHGLGEMPIVVGEMGWKSKTKYDRSAPPEHAIEVQLAHPVNQKLFYDAVMAWAYGPARGPDSPDAAIYFEAFDEPWKDNTGDDGWGLFDVERRAKYVIWDLFPERKPKDAPAYGAADAVHYRP